MKKNLTLLLSALVLFLPIISYGAETASITLSPLSGNFTPGKNFSIDIGISPNGQDFDTARVVLKYPANLLEIKSFSFGPAFAIPSGENSFDNAAGIFTYGAGIPEGANQNTIFGTIAFSPKSEGNASVQLDSESLILSAGENIFSGALASASYKLQKPVVIARPETIKPIAVNKNPASENKIVKEPAISDAENNNLTNIEPEIVPIVSDSAAEAKKTQTASILDAAKKFIFGNFALTASIILAMLILLGSVVAIKNAKLAENNINEIKKHEN